MRTRCSYIENDSVTYQIDITILDDNSLSIELKISFNVKKRVESFKPLFLDCMTTKRIDYIKLTIKKSKQVIMIMGEFYYHLTL